MFRVMKSYVKYLPRYDNCTFVLQSFKSVYIYAEEWGETE